MSINFLNKPYLLFDGAMGSMLISSGLKRGEHPESLNITRPELIESIHRQYIEAGSDIITANTFGANEIRLSGSGYSVDEVVRQGIKIARMSAPERLVALDIGPTGDFLDPIGHLTKERAYSIFSDAIIPGAEAGADCILIETFSDLAEAECAVSAAKKNTCLPVICTFTFQAGGKTFTGHDVKKVTQALESMGVDVLGVNCSVGPKDMLPIVEEMLSLTKLPVMVQPNAGLPDIKDGIATYNITPEEFAGYLKIMREKGARILGGCCGTTPDYIRMVKEMLDCI